ncbi:transferase [Variovorax sp. YR752]|uniref:spermine/spermidine synthase domain-containing protein n=1 Tax=Variovorax sp. YR752 TaxID=1884383 RepID=UPI003137B98B
MPETLDPARHVKPFVYETLTNKALHFSIAEIQSRMRLSDPFALDLEYTRTMMGFLLFQPDPRQIAMIGLGGGSLAKFCHRYLPDACIEVVEINPHVIALREQFHVPPDDARLRVLHGDGAKYVRDSAARVDVLVVDGFDSDGLPGQLCSQRFYDDCFDMLAPGGVMVVNLHYGHLHYQRHLDRIQRSFDAAVLVVDDGELSNSIVFAGKGGALDRVAPGLVRRPSGLARGAADQLLGAFAQVSRALKDRGTP